MVRNLIFIGILLIVIGVTSWHFATKSYEALARDREKEILEIKDCVSLHYIDKFATENAPSEGSSSDKMVIYNLFEIIEEDDKKSQLDVISKYSAVFMIRNSNEWSVVISRDIYELKISKHNGTIEEVIREKKYR